MRVLQSLALAALVVAVAVPRVVIAQGGGDEEPKNPWNDGLTPGNYLRIGYGSATPVSAHAALRYWDQGQTYSLGWENWDTGSSGVGRVGFSLNAAYSILPLNQPLFVANFQTATGGTATSANASHAGVIEVTSGIRLRMPLPYVMPSFTVGLGLIDWQPGAIEYQSATGTGKAQQQHRVSGEFTVGAGIDKNVIDGFAVFAEALYVYGYTSYGSGFATPGGVCATAGCDAFRNGNTTLGQIRGGLRVRVGR
jgi:hypothetical protein